MIHVYDKCPIFENEKYYLRLISADDIKDLLTVYSDINAVPMFNSDNCNGDDFHYETKERMKEAIEFWIFSYNNKYFVRWSIIDKSTNEVIGTIELFNRNSDDYFNNCGILRLDLRSDYENVSDIKSILSLIIEPAYSLFDCKLIAMKAIELATSRRIALNELGFSQSNEKLIENNGVEYGSYFEIVR